MIDSMGDRLKGYEAVETSRRLDAQLPVYARIDGRGFSKFTKGLRRPFDERMSHAMIETTKYLVNHTHARIGYTQSDEISLLWMINGENPLEQMFFDGKIQKMCSVLSGMATAAFTRAVLKGEPEFAAYAEKLPHFDARIFNLPSMEEAANAFLWRAQDARRNAIQMTAQHLFPHGKLQGKNQSEQLRMIAEQGVAFDEYPDFFRNGTFVSRVSSTGFYEPDELERIPEAYRPKPGAKVIRNRVETLSIPLFSEVKNRKEVIFFGENPVTAS